MTAHAWICPDCGRDDLPSPSHVCTDCEGDPMATMHERPAAGVDAWLRWLDAPAHPVGTATIRDDGATAIVSYEVVAQISHDQMLDLLKETR